MATLRRFVRPRPSDEEQCELCSQTIAPGHPHLFDPANRQLLCACEPCALLFSEQAATRFLRVPTGSRFLPDFRLSDARWDSFLLPVDMAFFFDNRQAGKVTAIYPSPGGPVESLLSLEVWHALKQENPRLQQMQPEVEALLVNRVKGARDYYLVPIDQCYELVGLIRSHWKGLAGGAEVWQEIDRFFAHLKQRSQLIREEAHA